MMHSNNSGYESSDEATPKAKRIKSTHSTENGNDVALPPARKPFKMPAFISVEASFEAMEKRFQSLAVEPTSFVPPMTPILLHRPIPVRSPSVARPVAQPQLSATALCLFEGRTGGRCRSAAITSETDQRGPQGPSSLRANGGAASPF